MTIYRARFTVTGIPAPALCTTYWAANGATSQQTATEAVARVRAFANSWAPRLSGLATVTFDLTVPVIDETTGQISAVVTAAAPAAVSPAQTGDENPGLIQGLAQFSTAAYIDGRALKGRLFMPSTMEFDNGATGHPNVTHLGAMNTALGLLGTTVVTASVTQVVWSRPRVGHPVLPDRAGSFANVTARNFSDSWAVLKSRRS